MKITKISKGVVRIDIPDVNSEWKQDFVLMSDGHLDHPNCDRKKFKEDMEMAADLHAMIIMAGDMCDATGGRNDPRRNLNSIRQHLKVANYYDKVRDEVVDLLYPYREFIAVMGRGNHENAVTKYAGTDILEGITALLKQGGSPVVTGGYGGFVRFSTYSKFQETPEASSRLYYHHTRGGTASPVTRGMIETNRQAVWLENVDYVLNGHNHQGYIAPIPRIGLNAKDNIVRGNIMFLRTPGYLSNMTEHDNWDDEFVVENNKGPSIAGCILMHMSMDMGAHSLRTSFEEKFK